MRAGSVSLRLALLDAQVVDCDRLPLGRVDDIELELSEGRGARVAALLLGSEVLGRRLGGAGGRLLEGASARLRGGDATGPPRVLPADVKEIQPLVRLRRAHDELPELAGLERWLARNVVGKLPGAGR